MSVARIPRLTTTDRVAALEQRADGHDRLIEPMARQMAEMYDAWTRAKTINWFVVKLGAWVGGGAGAVAVVLTIIEKTRVLLH